MYVISLRARTENQFPVNRKKKKNRHTQRVRRDNILEFILE